MIDRRAILLLGCFAVGEQSPAACCDAPRRIRETELRARIHACQRTACQLEIACSLGCFDKLGACKGVHEQLLGVVAYGLKGGSNRLLILAEPVAEDRRVPTRD